LRHHYLTWGGFEVSVDEKNPDMAFIWLTTKRTLGGVVSYNIEVQSDDYALIGIHEVNLHVQLVDYPENEVVVPIQVTIDPCIVSSFEAPPDTLWSVPI